MLSKFTGSPCGSRRGMSLLEIMGCVLAVGLGVWLGAKYLGLDLNTAAYSALSETKLIDKLPKEWRPAPPAGSESLAPEQQAVALRKELDSIRQEVAVLKEEEGLASDVDVATLTADSTANLHPDLAALRQHTLAFWSRLGGIRAEVDKLQASAEETLNEQNVWKVLEIRRRAYIYGAKAVKSAMRDEVDPQALQFAEQLVAWYEHGAALYGEAMNVWQGQHLPPEGLSSDQLLQQVRKQHDNEALLLFQKSGRLCEVLIRRYQVAFPEIEESLAKE